MTDERLEVYAPYTCRYKFYSSTEGRRCLQTNEIRNTLFDGDTNMRELYMGISDFLGLEVAPADTTSYSEYLLTKFGVSVNYKPCFHCVDDSFGKILLNNSLFLNSQGYVTDFGFLHMKVDLPNLEKMIEKSAFHLLWKDAFESNSRLRRIYVSPRYSSGGVPSLLSSEVIKRVNNVLREKVIYSSGKFKELNLYLLGAAKADVYDGVNMVDGSVKNMALLILLILCAHNAFASCVNIFK